MIQKYKISKITGPSGVFSGYILFIFGIGVVYFSLAAIPVILLGAAMAFSYNATYIDLKTKRYCPQFFLFGFIPIGSWVSFEPADRLSVKHFKGRYTTYSRSNRSASSAVSDYRVILTRDADGRKIPLACFGSEEEAREMMQEIEALFRPKS